MLLLQDDVCVSTSVFLFLDSAKEAMKIICLHVTPGLGAVHIVLNKLF